MFLHQNLNKVYFDIHWKLNFILSFLRNSFLINQRLTSKFILNYFLTSILCKFISSILQIANMAAILAFLFHWVEILFFKFTDFNFTIFFFFSYDLPLFGKFFCIFSLLNLFLYPLTKKGFKGYAYIYFTFFVLSLHYCKF